MLIGPAPDGALLEIGCSISTARIPWSSTRCRYAPNFNGSWDEVMRMRHSDKPRFDYRAS